MQSPFTLIFILKGNLYTESLYITGSNICPLNSTLIKTTIDWFYNLHRRGVRIFEHAIWAFSLVHKCWWPTSRIQQCKLNNAFWYVVQVIHMFAWKKFWRFKLTCDFPRAGRETLLSRVWLAVDLPGNPPWELELERLLYAGIFPSWVIKLFIGCLKTVSIYFDMNIPVSPQTYERYGLRLWGMSPNVEQAKNRVKLTKKMTTTLCWVSNVENTLAEQTAKRTTKTTRGWVIWL